MTCIRLTSILDELSIDDVYQIKIALREAGYSAIPYRIQDIINLKTKVLIETNAPN